MSLRARVLKTQERRAFGRPDGRSWGAIEPARIMIDEPTEGRVPKLVELVAEYLRELKRCGISVLLVKQKLTIALEVGERCLVMWGTGRSCSRARRPS